MQLNERFDNVWRTTEEFDVLKRSTSYRRRDLKIRIIFIFYMYTIIAFGENCVTNKDLKTSSNTVSFNFT